MSDSATITEQLKQIFDPEIPVNIVDLGLIYDVQIENGACKVTMTLTSQSCPSAKELPDMVKRNALKVPGVQTAEVTIVWEPAWTPQRITAEGRQILGIEDEAG